MLALVPAVSCVLGVAGPWELYRLSGWAELRKPHLLSSKKGPYLWGQHWQRLCLAGDLACGPVPGKAGSSLFLPAGRCS